MFITQRIILSDLSSSEAPGLTTGPHPMNSILNWKYRKLKMHLLHLACDHPRGATQPTVERWLFPLVTQHFHRIRLPITGLGEHPNPKYGFNEFSFSSFVLKGSLTVFSRLALNSWPQVILQSQPRKYLLGVHGACTHTPALAAVWFLRNAHHSHTIVKLRDHKLSHDKSQTDD